MPIFKAINKSYYSPDDLRNLINYMIRKDYCKENVYGAQGILKDGAGNMYQQMLYVKKYFRKEEGRQALHYVLSFSKAEEEYIGLPEALEIGYVIANFFCGWQVVFGIHTNTDNLHIHFTVNNTSYENGKSISIGPWKLQVMQSLINSLVSNYYIYSMPKEQQQKYIVSLLEA